jgi:soluble P-type ATPase
MQPRLCGVPDASSAQKLRGVLDLTIPGFGELHLRHLVVDYNGTLALDGELLPGVAERLMRLADALTLHVVTADTFGTARARLAGLPCTVVTLPHSEQAQAKCTYVESPNPREIVCVGNGRNDRLMLQAAAVGIAVVQGEGASADALAAADLVVPDICVALDLLVNPQRLLATLRT